MLDFLQSREGLFISVFVILIGFASCRQLALQRERRAYEELIRCDTVECLEYVNQCDDEYDCKTEYHPEDDALTPMDDWN